MGLPQNFAISLTVKSNMADGPKFDISKSQ